MITISDEDLKEIEANVLNGELVHVKCPMCEFLLAAGTIRHECIDEETGIIDDFIARDGNLFCVRRHIYSGNISIWKMQLYKDGPDWVEAKKIPKYKEKVKV